MSKFSSTDSGATILSKLNNTIVTVGLATGADYVCDGTADDVQIQAAITAVSALGGTVFIRAGSYDISAAITVPSNVIIEGEGVHTILTFSYAGSAKMFCNSDTTSGNSNIWFRNLKLIGNSSTKTNGDQDGLIYFYGVTNFLVENCYLNDSKSDGVDLRETTSVAQSSGKIINNIIDGIGRNGIGVEGGDSVIITGNTIKDCDFDGIDIEGGTLSRDIVVEGNNISDFMHVGISLYPSTGTRTAENIVIKGNNIRDTKTTGLYRTVTYTSIGIMAKWNTGNTILNVNISNNNIYNIVNDITGAYGIQTGSISGINVSNNTVDTVTGSGTSIGYDMECNEQVVNGNRATKCKYGFNIALDAGIITGNFAGDSTASGAGFFTYSATNCLFSGNISHNNNTVGMQFTNNSTGNVAIGNYFFGATQTTGITVNSGCTGTVLLNNFIANATTAEYNTLTDTIVLKISSGALSYHGSSDTTTALANA
jgi:hypothetical protein